VTFVPLGFAAQLLIWAVTSLIMTFVWLKYFKNPDRTRVGQAKEGVLGSTGLVSKAITDLGQGEILFQRPVLGSDRWPVVSDRPIPAGAKARVVDVLGQTLKIEQL
jgi:hypothetical protein